MIASIETNNKFIEVDLSDPIDISIPLRAGKENVNAWYVDPVTMEPVRTDRFIGSIAEGGAVNFRNIYFNPHGNGTHTECVGHIAEEIFSINSSLKSGFCMAEVISVAGRTLDKDESEYRKSGDIIIELEHIQQALEQASEALIIRTVPNAINKLDLQYSNTNPPYLCAAAAAAIRSAGIKHLLIDLPSVDRELDGGKMLSHRAFWNYPEAPRMNATITELIFVPDEVPDGHYLLNIQIAPFVNDASPSKPVLYHIR